MLNLTRLYYIIYYDHIILHPPNANLVLLKCIFNSQMSLCKRNGLHIHAKSAVLMSINIYHVLLNIHKHGQLKPIVMPPISSLF